MPSDIIYIVNASVLNHVTRQLMAMRDCGLKGWPFLGGPRRFVRASMDLNAVHLKRTSVETMDKDIVGLVVVGSGVGVRAKDLCHA